MTHQRLREKAEFLADALEPKEGHGIPIGVASTIRSLLAELDAARKDAERWQYFVSHMGAKAIRDAPRRIGTFGVFHINGVYTIHEISEGDDLVSTIDAALNADREKGRE